MALRNSLVRYGTLAMTFHWLIALGIVGNFCFGLYVADMDDNDANHFPFVQLHKSIGLTILALAFLRLIWRLIDPPPPLPANMPGWERFAAKLSHWLLYGLMFAVPLAGWATVSTSRIPTFWFGLFEWPHLPVPEMTVDQKKAFHDQAFWVHSTLAWTTIYVLVVHVLAALKHQFVDRDTVLKRMLPGTKVEP